MHPVQADRGVAGPGLRLIRYLEACIRSLVHCKGKKPPFPDFEIGQIGRNSLEQDNLLGRIGIADRTVA